MRTALMLLILAACALGCRGNRPRAAESATPAAALAPLPASASVLAAAEPPKPLAPAAAPARATTETAASSAKAPAKPAQANTLTGRLLERIVAMPYCYLRLQTAQGEVWAAIPDAKLEVGSEVVVEDPVLMDNFESKTLKRTFPGIYFGTLAGTGAGAAPAADPHASPHGNPHQSTHGKPAATRAAVGKVGRATGPDSRTVAEIWSQKEQLAGRAVTVRGQVVKYNAGVMGKNWIHLQDGSGNAGKGTHDLAVTTTDQTAPGTVVTARGVVRTRKDFGSGYAYEVLLEDAALEKR
ncbi:hypothetical protein [Geothrix edaphica]|uniref:DNA-binding protein n=1 Tax=Geothrix edaphica TaxID=2927976 RepID=A0ABQ5PZN4_9BACT|nr:hypothetical protein [Geothrix edaphica]GLH67818.1 hypothetical protein GETHED_21820 [Geothrix edaphica]